MSVDAEDFLVFEAYRNAGGHAFSNGTVWVMTNDGSISPFSILASSGFR